ncbi:MAG: hypothetical protein Q9162_004012 [Coniocarpon cinnabarinum]
MTLEAALCPPLIYYLALLLLAPPPPQTVESTAVRALRNVLALLAAFLFFRLPLAYHVPFSIGLNYQLGLVGVYGGCRVIDAFFISLYVFHHVPRRVRYYHRPREKTPVEADGADPAILKHPLTSSATLYPVASSATDSPSCAPGNHVVSPPMRPKLAKTRSQSDMLENMNDESYGELMQRLMIGPEPMPVTETVTTEHGWPRSFMDRASWALELELSMRGVGFSWTTADVRHTRKTWLPTVANRLHSIFAHVGPILIACWAIIRYTFVTYLAPQNADEAVLPGMSSFDERLSVIQQLVLTGALGSFLMAAFSLAHSLFAILLSPLTPSPLAFFPALYTTRVWDITSVRGFWSHGWHRLFARLFLVWGVWPGEWLERKVLRKAPEQPADLGKVLGGFASSALVHSFSVRCVLGGRWQDAKGEAVFFILNGVAVVLEGGVRRYIEWQRSKKGIETMWYDAWVGRVWWMSVLLFSGRNFARGWTQAGLVREMAFL